MGRLNWSTPFVQLDLHHFLQERAYAYVTIFIDILLNPIEQQIVSPGVGFQVKNFF